LIINLRRKKKKERRRETMNDGYLTPTGVFWGAAAILVAVHVLSREMDLQTRLLVAAVAASAVWYAALGRHHHSAPTHGGQPSDEDAVSSVARRVSRVRSGATKAVDPDLWTLRNPVHVRGALDPAKRMRHVLNRPSVARAVAALPRSVADHSKAATWRLLSCLEDFYSRWTWAIDDRRAPADAEATMPILLDTRAEALNIMNGLSSFGPGAAAGSEDVRRAAAAVRRDTQRCVATLARKHAPHVFANREWRPPYGLDRRRDALYHMSY
jgi:hypothetical protein